MKKLFTLAAMGALAATSLDAAAQFTVDGMASATEIGTGIGKYQLVASYTNTHSEADRGLRALYVGYTATTLNIMIVGSAESMATSGGYRALILYLNTPGRAGTPAGTQLLGGTDGQSPLKHKPTMDMEVDYGFRTSVGPTTAGPTDVYFSRVSYATGTGVTPGNERYLGQGSKAGAVVTAPATVDLAGSQFSYRNTATLTANTTNAGFEIEIPLTTLGTAVTVGSRLEMFAAYTNGDGVFTAEIIPQVAGRTTPFGTDPNFTTVAGTQALTYVIGTGVLANRNSVAAALGFQVYPNPAQAATTVAYQVPAGQQSVSLAVYNSLGQLVRSFVNEQQAGAQKYQLNNLAAGAYLVKLQVGDQVTSRKLILE